MTKKLLNLLVVAAICGVAPNVTADVIIGNLGSADNAATGFGTGTTTVFKAAGWTMGSQDFFLDSVTLALDFENGTGSGVFEIWSGSGTPTTNELTLDSPTQVGTGDFTFTTASTFVMESGETYWIFVTADPNSDRFRWRAGVDAPSGSFATDAGYVFNGNPSTFQNRYEVNGTVPEPGFLGLLALCMLPPLSQRRR